MSYTKQLGEKKNVYHHNNNMQDYRLGPSVCYKCNKYNLPPRLPKTSASASTGHIKTSHVDFTVSSLFTKAVNVNEEHRHGTGTVQKQ
jgi:hypothetical protein